MVVTLKTGNMRGCLLNILSELFFTVTFFLLPLPRSEYEENLTKKKIGLKQATPVHNSEAILDGFK